MTKQNLTDHRFDTDSGYDHAKRNPNSVPGTPAMLTNVPKHTNHDFHGTHGFPEAICYGRGRSRFPCVWRFPPPGLEQYYLRLTVSTSHIGYTISAAAPQGNEIRASEDTRAILGPTPAQLRNDQAKFDRPPI